MKQRKCQRLYSQVSQFKGTNLIASEKSLARKVIHTDNWRTAALGINRKYLMKYFSNTKLLSSQKDGTTL